MISFVSRFAVAWITLIAAANSLFAQAGAAPVPAPKQAPPAVPAPRTPPVAPPAAPGVTPPGVTPPAATPGATTPGAKPATPADEAVEVSEARQMSVTTEDGVAIKFSYYASGEESVPVILLHGAGGSRDDLKTVAEFLQGKGHSVVVPDLRGHGESTSQTKAGREITLDHKTQNAADVAAMVTQDMTKIWNFLLNENNEKVVNIKKLCIVGVDMGAIVAVNFVAKNYIEPDYRNQPRGKDVKALVLVSPPSAYRGASYTAALKQPAFKGIISTLIAVGKDGSTETRNADQLEGSLSKFAGPKAKKDQLVMIARLNTKLQGAELLSNPQLKLAAAVDGFIQKKLVEKNIPWEKQIAF